MQTLTCRIKLIEELPSGRGFQYLLNEAYKITNNPMLLHNMDYELIACTQNIVTDDPLWNEFSKNGFFSRESIEFFKTECFIDAVANAKVTAIMTSDKLKYDRYFGKVFNRDGITVANLVIIACKTPFLPDDLDVVEALCNKLTKEIRGTEFYIDYGTRYHERIINQFVSKGIDDRALYSGHAANIDDVSKNYIYVAVADVSRSTGKTPAKTEYFRDMLKRMYPSFKYSIYRGEIIIIMYSDNRELNVRNNLQRMSRLFEQRNIYAGVSGSFENIFEISRYYEQAREVLGAALKSGSRQRVFLCPGDAE